MFKLEDILVRKGDAWKVRSFPELSLGHYNEEVAWSHIEPKGPSWHIKKRRPFVVVHVDEKYVYFILLTTVRKNFLPCDVDERYGIGSNLPSVFLNNCKVENPKCKWIGSKARIFKRKIGHRTCRIVLRISKRLLAENSVICGECDGSIFNDQVRFIVEEELQEWK